MVDEHAGKFPRDVKSLSLLPGFGRYTVHAVLSQGFDTRLPILEANSERVLCRLLGIDEDPKRTDVRKHLWESGERLLPRRRAGAFNQALMEIGALVCRPARPACDACPLQRWCRAHALGLPERIPRRAKDRASESVREVALVIRRGGNVLWTQRADQGRWPAMWEFPHLPLQNGEHREAAATRLLGSLGLKARLGPELDTVRHTVTRFRITLTCLNASYRAGRFHCSDHYQRGLWLPPDALGDYPVSTPQRKLLQRVLASASKRVGRARAHLLS
jgi:A/G-specific adenine glycosylase